MLRSAVDQMAVGFMLAVAPSGRLVFANRYMEALHGRRLVPGVDVFEYARESALHPDGQPYTPEEHPLAYALRGEVVRDQELLARRKGGALATLRVSAAPVRDPNGSITGAVAVVFDVSADQGETDRELMLGALGHDLRSPLATILANSDLLGSRGGLDAVARRSVERIDHAARRMDRMIRQLLDYTRASVTGGLPVAPRAIDLHAICRSVLDEMRDAHPDRALLLDCAGSGRGQWDPDRLAQLVSNLVANALAYGAPGSPVTVTVREQKGERILAVHNQGSAIDGRLMPRLFEPFERGNPRTPGMGLGLYIARKIVEAHGGSIKVESTVARGTTFRVHLPG